MRAIAIILFVAGCLSGQGQPNFSGTWKLLSRNDVSAKDLLVRMVEQKGNDLHFRVDRDQTKGVTDVRISIGGQPHVSDRYGIVSAEWKGEVLVVSLLYNPGTPRETEQVENWKLSEDGKHILDDTIVKRAGEKDVSVKRVFERQ